MDSNPLKSVLALAVLGLSLIYSEIDTTKNTALINNEIRNEWSERGIGRYEPSHRQMIWIYALEFCESGGRGVEAINPKDRDGTPSYYHFQWKPETFYFYAVKKYKILPDGLEKADYMNFMSDYNLQLEIVKRMMGDKSVRWRNEFPLCVQKLGLPPQN